MADASLETVLRAYGVQFDTAALEAALGDPEHGPGLLAWATDRLGLDTLLSKDELEWYVCILLKPSPPIDEA